VVEGPFPFKKRPTERCEIVFTIPRLLAAVANSCWVQWLFGSALFAGGSQAKATTAQTCSGVYFAGAPERG
jgi:hypothetical protein